MKVLGEVKQPIDLIDIYLQDEGFWDWLKQYLKLINHKHHDDHAVRSLVHTMEGQEYIEFMLGCYRSYSKATLH